MLKPENERWLPVPGFEGRYSVSDKGRIWSELRQRLRKTPLSSDGYPRICIRDASIKMRSIEVHRLMALAFLPNPDDLATVNHIDGNKRNNSLDNLEWCSHLDNVLHARRLGLRRAPLPPRIACSHSIPLLELSPSGRLIKRHASIKAAAQEVGMKEISFRYRQNNGLLIRGNSFIREDAQNNG